MSQQYSLRWNNHQPNFISMFTSLLNTQTLVDVTLTADGQQLLAHKVVLSACSSYFQSLFVENPNPHPIVILKDVTFEDLQTMVDFMYCGVVNVTEEELPRVLETAKLLKIKGLTEMPDSASLTRAPNERNGIEQADSVDSQRASPVPKRKRGKGNITNAMLDSCHKVDCSVQTVEPTTITMQYSSGTPRRNNDIVLFDNMSEEGIELIETPPSAPPAPAEPAMAAAPAQLATPVQVAGSGMADGGRSGTQRRLKLLRRQARVGDSEVRKQSSEPAAAPARAPPLLKHDSFPQYAAPRGLQSHKPRSELETSALLVRALPVLVAGDSAGVGGESAGAAVVSAGSAGAGSTVVSAGGAGAESAAAGAGGAGSGVGAGGAPLLRASHTPAVRSGPPLSCNFCWNTVDECGRILRRKTQYHCPECRTNLCIVPCFHEYHDGPESDSNTNVR